MLTGTFQYYSPLKGCGYIQPDDGSSRIFVSSEDIEKAGLKSVYVGKRVAFKLASDASRKMDKAVHGRHASAR